MLPRALKRLQAGDRAAAHREAIEAAGDDDAAGRLALHLAALLDFAASERDAGRARLSEAAARERALGLATIARHTEHALALLLNDGADLAKTRSYYRETWANARRFSGAEAQALIAKSLAELCLLGGRLSQAEGLLRQAAKLLAADEACSAELAAWAELVSSAAS